MDIFRVLKDIITRLQKTLLIRQQNMNAQNHEQDKLINLLVATSQDRDSHTIRTHLENRFGDSEVCEAVIAYSSALGKEIDPLSRTSKNDVYGRKGQIFTGHNPIPPPFQPRKPGKYGDGDTFTDGKGIN